jgi:hypothetical protein
MVQFEDFDRFETLADLVDAPYRHLRYLSEVRIKSELRMSPEKFQKQWEQKNFDLPPTPPS